uniref:Uncharacterized protein n=1 Tax=Pseudomonas syringae pv. actinidiae TaxID=103796 RepID=A0A286JZW0_PSESF|nr:hypothetical protein [Pseudomonas syringae pv. actinidiae]
MLGAQALGGHVKKNRLEWHLLRFSLTKVSEQVFSHGPVLTAKKL